MAITLLCAFVSGFFVGNGLPYYVAGSLGEGGNPSPFAETPSTNVIVGLVAILIGAVSWHFVDYERWRWPAELMAAAGLLAVGLIHARLWRNDPWGKRTREAR